MRLGHAYIHTYIYIRTHTHTHTHTGGVAGLPPGVKKLSLGAAAAVAAGGGGGGGAMSPADWMVAMQQRIGKVRHELKDRAHELKDRRKSEPITFQGLRRPDRCICVYMCVCVCVCVCDRGVCAYALYYI